MQIKVTDKKYSMNALLKENLDHLVKAVKRKWDGILLFDGVEGVGKTTMAEATAYYETYAYNPKKFSFGIDNIVFTVPQFDHAVNNLPPGSAIVWDEAVFGALGVEWASILNKTITKLMVTIRKKQLFINVVIPWIYMLQAYMAVGRTRALIHCITPDGISRGYFKFYDYGGKQQLYFKNKKFFTYYGAKEAFKGTFPNTHGLFFDESEYDKKKDAAIKSIMQESEDNKGSKKFAVCKEQRNKLIVEMLKFHNRREIAKICGLTYGQVTHILNGISA